MARLRAAGQLRAARLVERMPATDGVLDDAHVVALSGTAPCRDGPAVGDRVDATSPRISPVSGWASCC